MRWCKRLITKSGWTAKAMRATRAHVRFIAGERARLTTATTGLCELRSRHDRADLAE